MMSEMRYPVSTTRQLSTRERCSCSPLFSLRADPSSFPEERERREDVIPVAPALSEALQSALASYFPRSTPFSILLLHIAQFEHISMPPGSAVVHKRVSCHASAGLLEQVLHSARRSLRANDQVLVDIQGTGAAFFFPQVDREGITRIAERVSRSINLLQAETIIPPLQFETEVALGFGSYPSSANSPEMLLSQAHQIQEKIVFRPAVVSQPVSPRSPRAENPGRKSGAKLTRLQAARASGTPFMQIPSRLPTRLKQLVPYTLALELRCAPVGRDHNRLTVAMANPEDTRAISQLREATGMTIFPVSCEMAALETLLASGW